MKSDLYIFNKLLSELKEKCLNHDGNAGEKLQIKGLKKSIRDMFKKYYDQHKNEEKKDPIKIMVPEDFWDDILKEEEEFCSDCPIKEPKKEDCLICNKEEEE